MDRLRTTCRSNLHLTAPKDVLLLHSSQLEFQGGKQKRGASFVVAGSLTRFAGNAECSPVASRLGFKLGFALDRVSHAPAATLSANSLLGGKASTRTDAS